MLYLFLKESRHPELKQMSSYWSHRMLHAPTTEGPPHERKGEAWPTLRPLDKPLVRSVPHGPHVIQ